MACSLPALGGTRLIAEKCQLFVRTFERACVGGVLAELKMVQTKHQHGSRLGVVYLCVAACSPELRPTTEQYLRCPPPC